MECNGFNSDNYRYFRNIHDGTITKYSRENLKFFLFSNNFHLRIKESIEDYEIKEFDLDRPLDLLEYIDSQPPLVFKHDGYLNLNFEKGDYCLITEWLGKKLASDEIILSTILTGPESIRHHNQKKLNMVDPDEVVDSDVFKNSFNVTSLITRNSALIFPNEIKNIYRFNR